MHLKKFAPTFTSLCFFLAAASLQAQDDFHHFTFNVGGGFTAITGNISDRLDHGGHFQAGAGYNFNRFFSVDGLFSFHGLGITQQALQAANQPDGNGRVYTLTVNPRINFPLGAARLYITGGGGWLRRTVQFTQPTLAQTIIYDPWWGYYGPALVPANQILGSVSSNAGVWDAGAGVDFNLPRTRAKVYFEARYYDGLTANRHTTMVPITVGLRW